MDTYQKYDIAIKSLALIISAVIFVYGINSYNDESNRDFKRPFLTAQIEACKKLTEAVADKLWSLYYSQGALFLNNEALSEYRVFIKAVEDCPGKRTINECHPANFGSYQFNIAQACRNELVKTWGSNPYLWVEELSDPLL
ncbi:MAG: hypothetical protein GQ547_08610 [Methylophaga sp.]|nr:hypothetical protein [Methylophaga sp.]